MMLGVEELTGLELLIRILIVDDVSLEPDSISIVCIIGPATNVTRIQTTNPKQAMTIDSLRNCLTIFEFGSLLLLERQSHSPFLWLL